MALPSLMPGATGVLVLADGTILQGSASAPKATPWARSASTPP